MITARNTTNLRTGRTAEDFGRRVRSDAESQAIAREFLTELIGSARMISNGTTPTISRVMGISTVTN